MFFSILTVKTPIQRKGILAKKKAYPRMDKLET
jgi:hypothetical protein